LKESFARYQAKVEWHTYKNGLTLVSDYRDMGIELNNSSYDDKVKEIELLTVSTIDFKVLCEKYIELRESGDYIAANKLSSSYPLIKEAYDQLGASAIRTLKTKHKIQNALVLKSDLFKRFVQGELPAYFSIGKRYSTKEVKAKLEKIYSTVGITCSVKANDLLKFTNKAKEGNSGGVYYIITGGELNKSKIPVSEVQRLIT
jgi:hypothetical protein